MNNDATRREFLQTTSGVMAAMALMPNLEALASINISEGIPVAVIGAGRQSRAILTELQKIESVQVKAICDNDDSRLQSGLRRVRGAVGYASYKELLDKEKDIRAVFVATPTHLHKDIAVDALSAGKHVYCEAPLASTVEDCRALAQSARESDKVFQTGMQGRADPIYTLAHSFAKSGAIRDLVSVHGQYHKKTEWRTPASNAAEEKARNWQLDPEVSIGLAGEFGTHQFDVTHWFANRYPVSVRGSGSIRLHNDGRKIADTIHCQLTFENGMVMTYEATLANSFESQYELFCGTMGAIKLSWTAGWLFKEADAPTQGWEVYANRHQFHNEEGITLIADATQLAAQGKLKEGVSLPNPPLYYSIEEFFRSVVNQKPVVCTAQEGLRAAIVGILANQAVVTGNEIAIDPELFK